MLDIAEDRISGQELFKRVTQADVIADDSLGQSKMRLLTGDITYIARSPDNAFVALAIAGTREDFIWDVTRSAVRQLVDTYDRRDKMLKKAQIELAMKLRISPGIWAGIDSFYPVNEVIFLTQDPNLESPVV